MKKRYILSAVLTALLAVFTHHVWLGHKGHYVFYFHLFIIIVILGYLAALKLTSYLADFKSLKNQSRIDIVFLTLFFIMLFIPMSKINNAKISEYENRTLAKFQPLLTKDGKLNYAFGKNFEDWFNDRFCLRDELIRINAYLNLLNPTVRAKNAIWIKNKNLMLHNFHLSYKITENIKLQSIETFDRFDSYCKKHNCKLYVLIVPYNADIFCSDIKSFCNFKQKQKNNVIINEIIKDSRVKIIYLYNELFEAFKNNENPYYKTDHHWSEDGTFIGYTMLMNELQKDYPKIKILTKNDFSVSQSNLAKRSDMRNIVLSPGDTYKMNFKNYLFLKNKVLDTRYNYYTHNGTGLIKSETIDVPKKYIKTDYYPYGNNLKVAIIGSSMTENLSRFTSLTFKYQRYFRFNGVKGENDSYGYKLLKNYGKELSEFNPDVIILCITPANLGMIHQIFEGEQ